MNKEHKYSLSPFEGYCQVATVIVKDLDDKQSIIHVYTDEEDKDSIKEFLCQAKGCHTKSIEVDDIITKEEADWQSQIITDLIKGL